MVQLSVTDWKQIKSELIEIWQLVKENRDSKLLVV